MNHMLTREASLQRTKRRFFLKSVVPLSLTSWLRWGSFIALLLSWIFLSHVVNSKNVELIDVTGDLKVDAIKVIKLGEATDTIRFGVWGYCRGDIKLEALGATWHLGALCKPHPVKLKIDIGSELADILDLENVVELVHTAEAMMDAFVKLHPFSVAMGVIGWLLSMSRRSVLKWRTKTIMHMPNPEWAFIPAAVGFISTVILSVCYLLLQLGPNEVNAFKIDFKLFDIVAKLEINPGNARKYDHAAAICFGLALFFYLISVHTPLLPVRWQGRREEVVPIVQLEELPPFRLALRHIQRRKQGQSQDLELPKASSTHLNTEQYELSGYSPSSPPTPYTRDMQIIPSQRNHT